MRNKLKYLNDYFDGDEIDDIVTNVTNMTFVHHCYRSSYTQVSNTYKDVITSPQSIQLKNALDE